MEIIHLATGHAFEMLGSIAIVASLLFTGVELRHLFQAQRVTNLISLTRQHREIWSEIYRRPNLSRILNGSVDVAKEPVTAEESWFVTFLILHLHAWFMADRAKLIPASQAWRKDVKWFFSLPLPKAIWKRSKEFQDNDFVHFIDSCLDDSGTR